MKTSIFIGLLLLINSIYAQDDIQLKLQLMPDGQSWGVYAKSKSNLTPGQNTITGSGQVTLVMPKNYGWSSLVSVSGNWSNNYTVNGPMENPSKKYVSIGLVADNPRIRYYNYQETLLFTIKGNGSCPEGIYILNNIDDPFNPPNSLMTNPGNELTVFDAQNAAIYEYGGNYAPFAWDCHDNDNDDILNAHEDSNGNGVYDAGVDVSDLNEYDCEFYFSLHPNDVTVCSSSDTIFLASASVSQGSFTFGWQYSDDGGLTWTDIDFAGQAALYSHTINGPVSSGTDVLTVINTSGMHNRRFRAVANSSNCDSIISNYAYLSVQGPLTVTDQPDDVVECAGNPSSFTAIINNPGPTGSMLVNWQISFTPNNPTSWINIPNALTYGGSTYINQTTGVSKLLISNVSGLNGAYYRLAYRTSTCAQQFTNPAKLTIEGPIISITHPEDLVVCAGGGGSFTASVNIGPSSTPVYQWQVSADNGINWNDINGMYGGIVYANFNTPSLNFMTAPGSINKSWYRLAVSTNECNRVYSQAAKLTIEGPLTIVVHPQDFTNCADKEAYFYTSIINPGQGEVFMQWQRSGDNGATWEDIVQFTDTIGNHIVNFGGYDSDTLLVTPLEGMDGVLFRSVIWTSSCARDTTDAARLNVSGPITFTDQPDDISVFEGEQACFAMAAVNATNVGSIQYQWQRWTIGGWMNLSDTGSYSGATTNQLCIGNVTVDDNFSRYRCGIKTTHCDWRYTDQANLIIKCSAYFSQHPSNLDACEGEMTSLNVTATNTSTQNPAMIFQWQMKTAGSNNWQAITDDAVFTGATTTTLSFTATPNLSNRQFRCLLSTVECPNYASAIATVRVFGNISISSHPADFTNCATETASFTVQAMNSGAGMLQYAWQISTDGSTWTDLANGVNIGATNLYYSNNNTKLNIYNLSHLIDGYYFRAKISNPCSTQFSNAARLNVEGPISVALQPQDVTVNDGEEADFWADFNNQGASYPSNPNLTLTNHYWQVSSNGGSTWINITAAVGIYTGITGTSVGPNGSGGDTLNISNTNGLNGTMYRIAYVTPTCSTPVYSNPATLYINGAATLTITDQPDDVTLCAGEPASFSVGVSSSPNAGVVLYQWQRWTSGGWVNLSNSDQQYNGAFTNQLNIPNSAGLYNAKFRCGVKLPGTSDWQYSDQATLTLQGPITFNLQPQDITICSNKPLLFNTTVTNPGAGQMNFRWQYKAPNDDWKQFATNAGVLANIGVFNDFDPSAAWQGSFGQDLNLTNSNGLNGYQFRLVVSLPHCHDTSNVVTVSVLDACQDGSCDLDRDGLSNSLDEDDDNDQVPDFWELWMTEANMTSGWNYVDNNGDPIHYDPCKVDTDGDGLYDNQEDPDGDNISNGEEADGDGNFDGNPLDPNSPIVLSDVCLKVKLQYLSEQGGGWAVMARTFSNFVPSANAETTAGRITLVAPTDFELQGFTSLAGEWLLTHTANNLPGHPGRKYLTFELLAAQGTHIPYSSNAATPLFRFNKIGDCPDSLYIMENAPVSLAPNQLSGSDNGLNNGFELCGVYSRKAWRCKAAAGGPVIAPPVYYPEDSLTVPDAPPVDMEDTWEEGKASKAIGLVVSPNPASDFLNVAISEPLAEGRPTLLLHDLQGKKRMEMRLENSTAQFDLAELPPGVYFLSLTQNGRVLQREKVIKQ